MSDAQAGDPPGGDTADGGAAAPWYGDIQDADLKGYVENKGWKDPVAAISSYRSLERMVGADKAGRTVVLPGDNADPTEVDAFFNKLGRPESPDKYELDLPAEHDPDLAKWFRETAHKHGLSGKQAKGMLADWQAMMGQRVEAMHTEAGIKLQADQDALKREWGSAYQSKIDAAKAAVRTFGVSKETIDALEQAMGYGGVMKFFDTIASKMSPQQFVSADDRGGGFGPLTPAAALDRINSLKADKAFVERLMKHDASAQREWNELHKMAVAKAS